MRYCSNEIAHSAQITELKIVNCGCLVKAASYLSFPGAPIRPRPFRRRSKGLLQRQLQPPSYKADCGRRRKTGNRLAGHVKRAPHGNTSNPSAFDGAKANTAKGMDTKRFPVESVSWEDICGKDGKAGRSDG